MSIGNVGGTSWLKLSSAAAMLPAPGHWSLTYRYTVKSGDTVYAIAKRFHQPIAWIVSQNHLKDASHIVPGQVLAFPEFSVQ